MEKNIKDESIFSNQCYNISNNLLSILNENFLGEFITLEDFFRIDGKPNNYLFYHLDDEGNLESFNMSLNYGYKDDDDDLCSDTLDISIYPNNGEIIYNKFCLYQGDTPINEINKAIISRVDDSFVVSYSKLINDGYADYEECSDHFVDSFEIDNFENSSLFEKFDKSIEKNKVLKQL